MGICFIVKLKVVANLQKYNVTEVALFHTDCASVKNAREHREEQVGRRLSVCDTGMCLHCLISVELDDRWSP